MKQLCTLLCLSASVPGVARQAPSESEAVKQTVTAFFDGMRRGDSALVRRTLAPAAVFHSFGGKPGQAPTLEIENINGFL